MKQMLKRLTLLRLKFCNPNVGLEPLIVVDVAERVVGRFNKRKVYGTWKFEWLLNWFEDQLNSNIAFELFESD